MLGKKLNKPFLFVVTMILIACAFYFSTAFVSIVLFGMLRDPLNVMPQAFMAYGDANVSLGHISAFLNTQVQVQQASSATTTTFDHSTSFEDQVRVGFATAAIFQYPSGSQGFEMTLDRPLLFPVGKLSIISGASKSGKTSLLSALLGDMTPLSSEVEETVLLPSRYLLPKNRLLMRDVKNSNLYMHQVAYVAQKAWIEHGTIRENILFSEPWDDTRYRTVLHQCDLLRDLSLFDHGDLTPTSDRGISGSGKKKAVNCCKKEKR